MVSVAIVSLVVGLLAGWIGQRSRFCTIGGLRDLLLVGDAKLLTGLIALFVAAWFLHPLMVIVQPTATELREVTASEPVDDQSLRAREESAEALAKKPSWWRVQWTNFRDSLTAIELVVFVAGIGLGFVSLLMDGCPYRQHVMAGQGRIDSIVYLAGFYVAALLFPLWSTPLLRLIF